MLNVDAKAFVPAPPGLSLFDEEAEGKDCCIYAKGMAGCHIFEGEAGVIKPDFLLMCDENCSTACPSPELMATPNVFYGSPMASPCFSPWSSPVHGFSAEAPHDFDMVTQFSLDHCLEDFELELSGIDEEELELSGPPSSEEALESGFEQEVEQGDEDTSIGFKLEGVELFQDMLKALLAGSTTVKVLPPALVQSEAAVEAAGEDTGAETNDESVPTEVKEGLPDYSPSVSEFPALISSSKSGNASKKPQRSYLKAAKKAAPEAV